MKGTFCFLANPPRGHETSSSADSPALFRFVNGTEVEASTVLGEDWCNFLRPHVLEHDAQPFSGNVHFPLAISVFHHSIDGKRRPTMWLYGISSMLKKRDEGKVAEMVVAMFLKRALAVTKENKIIFYDTVRRKEPTKQKN